MCAGCTISYADKWDKGLTEYTAYFLNLTPMGLVLGYFKNDLRQQPIILKIFKLGVQYGLT